MESAFCLYSTVNSYEKAITKNLKKIDEELLLAINDYGLSPATQEDSKNYIISMGMTRVVESYIKINFLAESALTELQMKLANLRHDSASQRTSFNAFALTENDLPKTNSASHSETLTEADFLDKNDVDLSQTTESVIGESEEPIPSQNSEIITTETVLNEVPISSQNSETVTTVVNEEPLEEINGSEPSSPSLTSENEVTKEDSPKLTQVTKAVEKEIKSEPLSPKTSRTNEERSQPKTSRTNKFTAVTKLLSMEVYDRRKEAERMYDAKYMDNTELKWKTVPKPSPIIEKKTKEKPTCYEIQDDKLLVDQTCTFCHVVTPSEFYVRTDQQLFESIEDRLNVDLNSQFQYVTSNFKSKEEAQSSIGNFAFIYLGNKRKWFRVEVLDWLDSKLNEVLIQLVDYGDKYFVQYKYLKNMSAFYAQFPKMAIKCHFAAVFPPDGTDSWPQCSIDALIALSEMNKTTEFLTIYVYKEGSSYSVDLAKSKNEKTISENLIENDFARQLEIPTEDKELETIFENDEEDDNTNKAVAEYEAQDEAKICPFTDKSGEGFKGPSCKLEDCKLSDDGVTDKTLMVTQTLKETPLPVKGDNIRIFITSYKTTCHFYAQILSYDRGIPNNCSNDCDKLIETMSSNNIVQTYIPFKTYPAIGEILVAKHSKYWYRGRCLSIESDHVKVFLVDYGKVVNKQPSELRQIKDDFLHVPFQAVEFILDDVVEKSNIFPPRSRQFFEMVMNFKEFKAEVVEDTEPIRIKMYDDKGLDMSYVLKEYGIAKDRASIEVLTGQ